MQWDSLYEASPTDWPSRGRHKMPMAVEGGSSLELK